jgi:hypothetical protein
LARRTPRAVLRKSTAIPARLPAVLSRACPPSGKPP